MYVLDSSAIIEAIAGGETFQKLDSIIGDSELFTTTINLHEVLVGAINEIEKLKLEAILKTMGILEHDKQSAKIGAEIERKLIKEGNKINRTDILIASICKANNAHLITFDKDFSKIKDLQVTIL